MVINNHTTLEDDLLLLNSISLVRIEKGVTLLQQRYLQSSFVNFSGTKKAVLSFHRKNKAHVLKYLRHNNYLHQ